MAEDEENRPSGGGFLLAKKTPKGFGIVVRNYLVFLGSSDGCSGTASFLSSFSGLGIPYHADFSQQLFLSGGDHSLL